MFRHFIGDMSNVDRKYEHCWWWIRPRNYCNSLNIYIAEYTQDTGTGESATRAELVETCRKKISAEIALSTLGEDRQLQLLGEHASQTPCRELLIPLRGQGRGTRVDWTLLFLSSTSAERPQPTSGGCCPSEEQELSILRMLCELRSENKCSWAKSGFWKK